MSAAWWLHWRENIQPVTVTEYFQTQQCSAVALQLSHVRTSPQSLHFGKFLPPFVPPLSRPATADRPDNRLVPPPVRGAYDYQA